MIQFKKTLCAIVASTATLAVTVQADLEDHLTQRWFVTEVVIFERTNISDNNTLEALASAEPARQPRTLGSFASGGSEPVNLDGRTQAMLRTGVIQPLDPIQPALDFSLPEPPSLDPTQPAPSAEALAAAAREALQLQLSTAVTAYEMDLANRSFVFNADENPRLSSEVQRLNSARNYRILWRGNWLQPVPARDAPMPLLLQAGPVGDGRYTLEGSIGLTVSRYLHLQARLWYHDPSFGRLTGDLAIDNGTLQSDERLNAGNIGATEPNNPASAGEPQYMLLNATRRMRSGILHYLDHPKLGLLVRVDPLEAPEALLTLVAAAERAQQ